jgi:hypothetical protein
VAFTPVTVTNDYDLADGTDPVGTVSFTPTAAMVNGQVVVAAKVTERLNVDGRLAISLVANTDPATAPAGTSYLVEEKIGGATREYYVQIPHDQGSTIDLSTLATVGVAPAISFPSGLSVATADARYLTPSTGDGRYLGNDLRFFGAVGDGSIDDSAAIRTALAATPSGGTLYAQPGKTYLLGTALTAGSFAVPSGTTSMPYLLAIPDGVTFDLRGSTLKLGADAVMVTTVGALTNVTSTGAALVNGILDGNNQTLTSKFLVQIGKATGLHLDFKMINVNHGGLQLHNCTKVNAPYLEADTVVGQPYSLGSLTSGQGVTNSTFGRIIARNVTPDPTNTFNFPGNVFYIEGQRCTIDSIIGYSCSAGVKINVSCTDIQIGKILLDTVGDSAGNSGLKLQGDGTGGPYRIHVGQLSAKANSAHGLWIEKSTDCTVDSYIGEGNNTLGGGPDVWLGGIRDQIGSIRSTGAGADAILVRSYAVDFQIGTIHIRNPGQAGGATSRVGLSVPAGTGVVNDLVAIDDQGTPTMTRGISVTGTSALVQVRSARVSGATIANINQVASGATVARILSAGPPTYGQIVAATTSTITIPPIDNFIATTDPSTTSDSAAGYSVGSRWVNTSTRVAYVCLDATASAAVWNRLAANVQTFTSNGTWTKPAWCTVVDIVLVGGGAGGGSGARRASGTASSGGAGGGGGGYVRATFPVSLLAATEAVTVGAGGAGGTAVTANDTNGNVGSNGGVTLFGSTTTKVRTNPSGGGAGGATGAATAGSAGTGEVGAGAGGAGTSGAAGSNGGRGIHGGGGGGGGGGVSTTPAAFAGGTGGVSQQIGDTGGGTAGAIDGAGGAGTSVTANLPLAGGGGGGGGSSITTTGGAGGAGGSYGAGGGGGGSSLNGSNSGDGGAGAGGIVVAVSR